MKRAILCFLLLLLASPYPSWASGGRYEAFVRVADGQRARAKEEGLGYVVGGSTGLALSVALGIKSKEALPKIGYSLIQVLSAAAIVHGATLHFQGDSFTQEADRLRIFEKQLASQADLTDEQKKKILDETTTQVLRDEIQRYRRTRRIRGYLELATVASSGATLLFSESRSSASSSALAFITLISLVGAYADLSRR